jgi:hypothetical protein
LVRQRRQGAGILLQVPRPSGLGRHGGGISNRLASINRQKGAGQAGKRR